MDLFFRVIYSYDFVSIAVTFDSPMSLAFPPVDLGDVTLMNSKIALLTGYSSYCRQPVDEPMIFSRLVE